MNHITHGAKPGMATSIEKAPGAINTKGLTTDPTDNLNFATNGTQKKARMQQPVPTPTPDKAAILAALTKLINPPALFGFGSLTTKKRPHIQAIRDLGLGDFHVYTNNKTVYCKDLEAVQAFAQKLGLTK